MRPCQGRSRGFKSRLPLQRFSQARESAGFLAFCVVRQPSGKAGVCKASIGRFDSTPRLHTLPVLRCAQDFACGLPASRTLGLTPAKRLKFDSTPCLQPAQIVAPRPPPKKTDPAESNRVGEMFNFKANLISGRSPRRHLPDHHSGPKSTYPNCCRNKWSIPCTTKPPDTGQAARQCRSLTIRQ